jgi:thiol-disulfide isomerase/thioredoxin
MKLLFYTTLGCHLCEQAAQIIAVVAQKRSELEVVAVDIADDDNLMDAYGIRIPVVKIPERSTDLGWPFDESALTKYLEQA